MGLVEQIERGAKSLKARDNPASNQLQSWNGQITPYRAVLILSRNVLNKDGI